MANIKRLSKVSINWNSNLAYAIGLITADGNLSIDQRHINLTTKDLEMAKNFKKCLNINNKIGRKSAGRDLRNKKYFCIQFGDRNFYDFLLNIGLTIAKSKTLKRVDVPKEYFFDFLRGLFDGDGSFYSYWDPRWKSSFMFYTSFVSASEEFIHWLRIKLNKLLRIKGQLNKPRGRTWYQLRYAKSESLKLLKNMYYKNDIIYLSRKRLKISKALDIVSEKL